MVIAYTPIALLFLVSTVSQSMLLGYILTNRRTTWSDHTTRTLGYLLLGGIIWSGAYGIHILIEDPAAKLQWFNLSHIGPSIVVPALLLHISTYTGHYTHFTRRLRALLVIEPTITAGLVLTDSYHNLFRGGSELVTLGTTTVMHRSPGPWWYLRTTYLYVLVIVVLIWLLVTYRNSTGIIRRQLGAGLFALSVPLGLNVLFDLQFLLEIIVIREFAEVEFTGVAFGVSALILTYSVSRYQYLDLVPVGRAVAINRLRDPYLITDDEFRIVDYNAAVSRIVEIDDNLTDRSVFEILPKLEPILTADIERERPILKQIGDSWFEVLVEPLQYSDYVESNFQKTHASREFPPEEIPSDAERIQGFSIYLRDVSGRISREHVLETWNEQLELLNQIVRHDIRNDATFIVELTRRLRRSPPQSDPLGSEESAESRYLQQIEERGHQIVGLTESLRDLTETFSELDEERKPIPLDDVLEREIVNASMTTENTAISHNDEIPSVNVHANEMLSSVFRNLFENAIQHNDKPQPEVTVSTSVDQAWVTVRIADNGPGLTEDRKASINRSGRPDPSEGDAGFGLYIVRTLVDEYGGEMTVRDNDPEGTVFSIRLERVEK
ncbi:MAG: histidine kinase N-terminal 7TM domain-containing protein [Natronomonas sp.]